MLRDSYPYYLAGEACQPNKELEVRDKYTGEVATRVALADPEAIDQGIAAAEGSLDAMRDVKKQVQRARELWEPSPDDMPVHGTLASQFNDAGTNRLYVALMNRIVERTGAPLAPAGDLATADGDKRSVIPPDRVRYLDEIKESAARFDGWVERLAALFVKREPEAARTMSR